MPQAIRLFLCSFLSLLSVSLFGQQPPDYQSMLQKAKRYERDTNLSKGLLRQAGLKIPRIDEIEAMIQALDIKPEPKN